MTAKRFTEDEQDSLLEKLEGEYRSAEITDAELAMLDYAHKLTVTPQQMLGADVDELRKHGYDDLAIHDICTITAYFNFVNRMADGLGVELEEH